MTEYICDNCGKSYKRYPSQIQGKTKCCSFECKHALQKISFIGKDNPNYRKGIHCEISICPICGNKKDYRAEVCVNCYERHTFLGKHHTEETKRIIGIKSKEKFTPLFKKKHRETMERLGRWFPEDIQKEYRVYFVMCNWDFGNNSAIKNYQLLCKHGFFCATSNINGVVRDHIFSRRDGFKNNVFPKILKHPANCQFLTNVGNIKKGSISPISLTDLFDKIQKYNGDYKNHNTCLNLIASYKNGKRYTSKKEDCANE